MKLIAAGITLVALVVVNGVQFTAAAVAAGSDAQPAVGLYAPDRYNGIAEMCLMPMDFGHCRAKVKRYYFDMRRMKCSTFYWGGCAGNINNFKSLEECNKACLNDNYIDEVNSNNRNYIDTASDNKNNNENKNAKNNNIIKNKNFKSTSNYKNEQRRIDVDIAAKTSENNNNRNDNADDQDEEDEEYQQ